MNVIVNMAEAQAIAGIVQNDSTRLVNYFN